MLAIIRRQSGDTIIEVMIVLAVLGLAIGISYATANRSLLNTRQAQENSQATAAAQSQVEQLISIGCASGSPACDITNAASPGHNLIGGGTYCIDAGQVKDSTDPACQSNTSLPANSNPQIEITCLSSGCVSPRVFQVKISWDDVLGGDRDTVTQDYILP